MAKPKPVNPKIAELQADIDTLIAIVNDPDMPDDIRADSQKSVDELTAEIEKLSAPKAPKVKKEKPAKAEIRFGEKSFKETSSKELEEALGRRLSRANELGGKSKTKPIFSSRPAQTA